MMPSSLTSRSGIGTAWISTARRVFFLGLCTSVTVTTRLRLRISQAEPRKRILPSRGAVHCTRLGEWQKMLPSGRS